MFLDILEFQVNLMLVAVGVASIVVGIARLLKAAWARTEKHRDPVLTPAVILCGLVGFAVLLAAAGLAHGEALTSNEHQLEVDSRYTGGYIETVEAVVLEDGTAASLVTVRGDDGARYPYVGSGRIDTTGRVLVEYIFTNTVLSVRDEPDGCTVGPFRLSR